MLAGGVHDHALRQEALQVQAHVRFGRGFAAAMPGPVQRVGHELDDSRVHDVNGNFEPVGAPAGPAANELRRELPEMLEHTQQEPLGQVSGARRVGVGKAVAAGRNSSANARQGSAMKLQSVGHIVEADGMRQLGEEERHHMAPVGEASSLLGCARLPGQIGYQVARNEVANLFEN